MKCFLLTIAFFATISLSAQTKFNKEAVVAFQSELNASYKNKAESPLTDADFKTFIGHDFYPISANYYIVAQFIRTEKERPFEMPTTGNRKPQYVKYGEARFTLNGKRHKLNIYQNIELVKKDGYKDYLFLPFTDLTSGIDSYGGGRYLDLKTPKGDTIVLDFNQAYNPYCAYSHKYSCPIPPEENNLKTEVKAGVKKFN